MLDILDATRKRGARGAEILRTWSATHNAQWIRGKDAIDSEESITTRLIVYLENGRSQASDLGDLNPKKLEKQLDKVIQRAEKSKPSPQAAPADRFDIPDRGLGIDDPRYSQVDDETRLGVLQQNLAYFANTNSDPQSLKYRDVRTHRIFASTRGVHASNHSTSYELEIQARHRTSGIEQTLQTNSHAFSHVASIPYGSNLSKTLDELSGPRVTGPERVPLVLSPEAMSWIIARMAPAFSATAYEAKQSFLNNLDGEPIASRRFHIVDDASLPGAMNTRAFDDRGVPPVPVAVIREGTFGGLYHSPETARRADTRPTGHVVGDKIQPGNLVVRHGNRSRTQMLSEVPVTLFITSLSGELNPKTGILNAYGSAYLLEKGKPVGCTAPVLLKMPVTEILREIKEISSDQQRYGEVDCATVLTNEIEVSGYK